MKHTLKSIVIGTAVFAIAGAGRAANLGVANDFNVFVLGNDTQTSTDAEGRVAVGGAATFANYGVGNALSNSHGTRDDLIVGGSLAYDSGQVFNGNIRSGAAASLTYVGIPNGAYISGNPIDFAAAGVELRNLSHSLAGLTANGAGGRNAYGQISLTGADAALNVFNLHGSDFDGANALSIAAPTASTVVLNIDGNLDQMSNFGTNLGGVPCENVIYNYTGAGSLTLSSIGIEGSLLAPNMSVNFSTGQINGTLVAGTLNGSGEAHYRPFGGNVPNTPNTPSVPEPSTLAMLGVGLLPLLSLARRKR
ncbi:MAG TPA: choice-of-anchor A family protein [Armatimonadota bacterium]|jgi:choice-of-anchor A domain-containing protein